MTPEEFRNCKRGDILVNSLSGRSYVVWRTNGNTLSLMDAIEATNPSEWKKAAIQESTPFERWWEHFLSLYNTPVERDHAETIFISIQNWQKHVEGKL